MSDEKKTYSKEYQHDEQRKEGDRFSSSFSRDKRPRTASKTTYKPAREGYDNSKRSSYNPNFTKDNRARKPYGEPSGENSDRASHDGNKYPDRNYGDKGGYGNRSGGYGNKGGYGGYGNKGGYGGKKYGNKPSGPGNRKYGKPSTGPIKTYGKGEGPTGEYPQYPAPRFDSSIRLNRFIATSGICSRREADEFIQAGLVSVNGNIVTELGTKIQPGDVVKFNDSIVRSEKKIYIIMNKPKGFVTSLEDGHADRTVMDIVRNACSERVYPVGRLDKNSLGVLLLTNDGDLTKQLTHPSHNKKKIYQVTLDKQLKKVDMEQIVEGIMLDDGEIHADEIAYVNDSKREIGIEIHSGRNRIVRRIFEHMGYKVLKLDRVYFAGLTKKKLRRGEWRFLTPREVAMLKSGAYE